MSMPRPLSENLTVQELESFMKKHGFDVHEFANLVGVSYQAVKLWINEKREISITVTRLIRLFDRKPSLMKEFLQ